MTPGHKLLVIALDAANPSLLRRWAADGTMPHLAAAMARGVVADTLSVEGMEVGATWPSFYTGLSPAGHGMCWTDRIIPGTYRERRMERSDFARLTPFWSWLGAAGKRVAILDVPFAPPLEGIPGIQVTEWGVHDGVFDFSTTPPSLARTLRQKYGVHPPPAGCDTGRTDAAGYRDLRDRMLAGISLRTAMTRELLDTHEWDFAIQVFNEAHCGGHMFWHYHDASHPNHDAAVVARDGDLLRDTYRALDDAIGELMEAADPGTTVMLASLHSMAHSDGSSLLLPHILQRLGVYRPAAVRRLDPPPGAGTAPPSHGVGSGRGRTAPLRRLYGMVPSGLREDLYAARQWFNQHILGRGTPIDLVPRATKAFQVGFGAGTTWSGIRLNLVGREPAGTLTRGRQVDAFVEELRIGLSEVVEPESGRPLVKRLVRTADLYQGPMLDELPDLLVEWHDDIGRGSAAVGTGQGGVWRGHSNRIGTVEHRYGGGRTGNHRREGLVVVLGEGHRPRALNYTVSVLDFAPTIAAMLGVTAPQGHGTIIEELLPFSS